MKKAKAKRTITFILSLAMVLSMLIGIQVTAVADTGETTINILHTNDVHGRFYMVDSNNSAMIGIDRIAAIRNETPNSILVDVGDTIHGLPIVNINRGLNAIELMVAAGYRVMVPGNHDFNYGSDRLLELAAVAAEGDLQIISSNVFYTPTRQMFLPSTTIIEIDGVMVGFFGLTTRTTPIQTSPENVAKLEFREYKASAENAIAELREGGAQVIVAMAHISREHIEALARELTDKPDVILEGHDHLLGDLVVDGVLIAGAGDHQRYLGVVSITLNQAGEITDRSASVISKEEADEIDGDPDVEALAEEIKEQVLEEFSAVVATTEILLSSARGSEDGLLGVRNSEQPLGNLVADAMRTISGADIALTNGGGLRADLRPGDLTKLDMNAVLPFGNVLVVLEVTPADIFAIMELGISRLPEMSGGFPQISGMDVQFVMSREPLDRITSITIDGNVLNRNDNTTKFTLVTNNFIAAGGDGYTMLPDLSRVSELGSLDDVLIEYITDNLDGKITAENARIDGRLLELPVAWALEEVSEAIEAGIIPQNMQARYNLPTTRIEFAQLAVALYELVMDEEIEVGEDASFEDTDSIYVEKAVAIGVVEGFTDGTFRPGEELTRQQAATMLLRLANALDMPLPEDAPEFSDNAEIASWAFDAVGAVQSAEIMMGMLDGSFRPQESYTRTQSILTMLRVFNLVPVE